jgi:hypothetical protein
MSPGSPGPGYVAEGSGEEGLTGVVDLLVR